MTEVVGPRRFQRFGIHFGQFQAFGTFQSEVGSLKSEVQRLGTPLDRSPRSTGVVSKDSKPLELASTRNEARTRRLNGLEPHWTGLCAARARVLKDSEPLDLVSTRNETRTRRLNGLEPHRIGLCAARAWFQKIPSLWNLLVRGMKLEPGGSTAWNPIGPVSAQHVRGFQKIPSPWTLLVRGMKLKPGGSTAWNPIGSVSAQHGRGFQKIPSPWTLLVRGMKLEPGGSTAWNPIGPVSAQHERGFQKIPSPWNPIGPVSGQHGSVFRNSKPLELPDLRAERYEQMLDI
jgi:hypothetical protein